jgi:hypothetical protein
LRTKMSPKSRKQKTGALFFGLPRFATMFVYTTLVTLTLPLFIVEKVGDQSKGKHLGLITAAAALLSVGILYAFGRYRDRESRLIQGPKYPLYGLGLMLPGLIILSAGQRYSLLIFAFFIIIGARSFCEGSHLAVLADRPQSGGRERLTAGIAFWHFLGTGMGAVSFGFFPRTALIRGSELTSNPAALAAVLVAASTAAYYFLYVRQQKTESIPLQTAQKPMRFTLPRDLTYLIGARIFFMCGILIISTFLLYIVRDLIAARNVQRTTALLYAGSIIGAVLASLPAGKLTERRGERFVLFLSGSTLALTAFLFFTLGRFHPVFTMFCMVAYGAGFALTFSAGLSLTVKLIPHPQMSGRIMAVITASTLVSQFLASLTGAAVLDPLNRAGQNLGYFVLLVLIEIYFIVGGVLLFKIKEQR